MKILGVSAGIVVFDQVTKAITRQTMTLGESVPVIKNFFHFTYITNDGMAFGINPPFGSILLPLVSIILTGVLVWFIWSARNEPLVFKLSLAIILGGAVGNLIDRLVFGKVVDFLDFMIGQDYHWYIFNVADSAVTIGFVLVLYHTFFVKPKTAEAN